MIDPPDDKARILMLEDQVKMLVEALEELLREQYGTSNEMRAYQWRWAMAKCQKALAQVKETQ